MYKLAICIPVYNRAELFSVCISRVLNEIYTGALSDSIQVIISDNASTDNILKIINDAKILYPEINIVYNRNNKNKGMAFNFLRVVELSDAKFCWIIGADDFVEKSSLSKIIHVLNDNEDINFISVAYSQIDLSKFNTENLTKALNNKRNIKPHKAPSQCVVVEKWDYLVDPQYNNVLLGAVMTGIFRKKLWDDVDKTIIEFRSTFSNFENTYPHSYIYAQSMIGKKSYYFGEPLIVVGNGAREWSTDTGNSYWNSYLPMIQLKFIDDMITEYEKNGLEVEQVKKCRKWSGNSVGHLLIPYVIRKKILKKSVMGDKEITISDIINVHKSNPIFYKSILLLIPQSVYFKLRIVFSKIMHGGAV